jgi:hypothetical protein
MKKPTKSRAIARIEPAAPPTEAKTAIRPWNWTWPEIALVELCPDDAGKGRLSDAGVRLLPEISGCGHAALGDTLVRQVRMIVVERKGARAGVEDCVRVMEEAMRFMGSPADAGAACLAAQLYALQTMVMRAWAQAENTTDEAVRAAHLARASRLHRSFIAAFEALDKHRRGGSQRTMRVEHVHVYEGGQAIVGPVQAGGPPTPPKNRK